MYRKSNRVYMDYDVVSTNLGTGPKAIQVFAEESTDLKTWSGAVRLILEEGYSAFISINSPQKWLRLRVTDPADYPAH